MSEEENNRLPLDLSDYLVPEGFLLDNSIPSVKKPINEWLVNFVHACFRIRDLKLLSESKIDEPYNDLLFDGSFKLSIDVKSLIDCICTGDISSLYSDLDPLTKAINNRIRDQFLAYYSDEERRNLPIILRPLLEKLIKIEKMMSHIEGATECTGQCKTISSPAIPENKTMVTVNYDAHRRWGKTIKPFDNTPFKSDNRPYEEVTLKKTPLGRNDVRLWCLVDTGADHLQVESSIAKELGIDLATTGTHKSILTASGSTSTITEIAKLDIELEGAVIDVKCFFGSNKTSILGRVTILSFLEIGFNRTGWLSKQ